MTSSEVATTDERWVPINVIAMSLSACRPIPEIRGTCAIAALILVSSAAAMAGVYRLAVGTATHETLPTPRSEA